MRFNSDKRMFNFAGCCLELLRSVLLVGAVTIYIILFLFRGNLLIMSKAMQSVTVLKADFFQFFC